MPKKYRTPAKGEVSTYRGQQVSNRIWYRTGIPTCPNAGAGVLPVTRLEDGTDLSPSELSANDANSIGSASVPFFRKCSAELLRAASVMCHCLDRSSIEQIMLRWPAAT